MQVGINLSTSQRIDTERLRAALARVAEAGLDHIVVGDHVSFHEGWGNDGLIAATAYAMLQPTLRVFVSVYLLPLRHPVAVARQVATLSAFAAGRLILGVGVGGEDRHEIAICGVDPATRGRRTNESMLLLRALLNGEAVTHHGEFYDLEAARILPSPREIIPLLVGGRSDAAIRRAARLGDGWIGIWNSVRRFSAAMETIRTEAERVGRRDVRWQHAMQVWCGLGRSREEARGRLARAMERTYQLPFESFERYCPYGRAEAIAEFLTGYVDAGCTTFNLIPHAADPDEAIDGAAEVKRLLAG